MFTRWKATLTRVCTSIALVVLATTAVGITRAASASGAGTEVVTAATAATVTAAPAITTQPVSQSVTLGRSITFTAAASGSPTPTVQWQVSVDKGSTWIDAPGATTPSFTGVPILFVNGWEFRAVFTNAAGSATTTAATLTIFVAPIVTTQPVDQSGPVGFTDTFTAAASGTPTPTVQWQVSVDKGTTWINAPGATTPTISGEPTAFENGWDFRAVFTNGGGSTTTNAATLTVGLPAVNLPPGVFWTGGPVDVALSRPTFSTVQVQWVTTSGPSLFLNQREWIADPAAFSPSSGTVTFAPGQTTAEISLSVITQSASGCSIGIPPSGCFPEVSIQLTSATNAQLGQTSDLDLYIF